MPDPIRIYASVSYAADRPIARHDAIPTLIGLRSASA